jgi:hypothetical protein
VVGVFRRPTFRDNVPCLVSACQPRKLALSLLPALFSSSHTPPPSSPCRPTSIACKRRCAQITRPFRCTRSPTWHCCIGLLRRYWLGSVYRAMMHQTPTRKGSTTGKKTCYTTIFFFLIQGYLPEPGCQMVGRYSATTAARAPTGGPRTRVSFVQPVY